MSIPRTQGSRRLQALFQKADGPVFALDAAARFLYVNTAWESLTGYSAAEMARFSCRPTAHADSVELAALASAFYPPLEARSGRPAATRSVIPQREGTSRFRTLEFWPLRDQRGNLLGFLGMIHEDEEAPLAPQAESVRLRADLLNLRDHLQRRFGHDALIGQGPAHQRLLDQVQAAAASEAAVLILGEPGTGRRLVARTIHQRGTRPGDPLVPFDCTALPADVLARELFEPARPAGTTLMMVEVLDLPRDLQGRLAHMLEGPIRLLATSGGDPDRALAEDRLRPDLYYRLTTLVIRLRPLRERLDEVPLLAQHLLERLNQRSERPRTGFTSQALSALTRYDWPGNFRELARVIDAAHAAADGDVIGLDAVPAEIQGNLGAAHLPPAPTTPMTPLDEVLEQVERRLIEQALQRSRHNKSKAAELLAISRPRLYRRIGELRIPEPLETVTSD